MPGQMGRPIGKCGSSCLTPTWPSARWGDPRSCPRGPTHGQGSPAYGPPILDSPNLSKHQAAPRDTAIPHLHARPTLQGWAGSRGREGMTGPCWPSRAVPWPTLDPEGGFRVNTAPQLHPCAIYTQGTWPPDRRGLMEPRASRDGLACDRALAGGGEIQRAGTASPQQTCCLLCMRDGPEER